MCGFRISLHLNLCIYNHQVLLPKQVKQFQPHLRTISEYRIKIVSMQLYVAYQFEGAMKFQRQNQQDALRMNHSFCVESDDELFSSNSLKEITFCLNLMVATVLN